MIPTPISSFSKSILLRAARSSILTTGFSTKPKEELLYINSQKINYIKVGNGPKNILCLPGALGTIWGDFKPQIEGLDKNQFTIVVWDPPGHGQSRPPERVFTPKFYQEDADTAYELIKNLGLKTTSLLGWSDGGIAGMILAAKYPQVVEKLVMWGSGSYMIPGEMKELEKIRDINNWSARARTAQIEIYGEKTLQELHNSWFNALETIHKSGGDICTGCLKDIQCPTLILHGDKDPLLDSVHPVYLLQHIKGAKLHRFPQGKHNIHLRYVEEFNEIVTKFILNKSML